VPLGDIEVPLMKRVFKELIWLGLCILPSGLLLESKKATLILLEGNLRTSYLKKGWLIISSEPYTHCHTGFHDLQHEGHVKLFNRLSDPRIDSSIKSHIHPRSRHWPS